MYCERRTIINPNQLFSNILIIYKIINPDAFKFTKELIKYLITFNDVHKVFLEKAHFELFNDLDHQDKLFPYETNQKLDLCIVLGGDGTVLWANNLFQNLPRPPFLTFNMGTLGYMSYYNIDKYKEILTTLFSHQRKLFYEKRSIIRAELQRSNDNEKKELFAMNDIIIERGEGSHAVSLDIYLNEEDFTTIRGDGIIIASSTGSTAYALSSGGAIVHYDVDSLILNAVSPHTLSFRPVVLPKDMEITVVVGQNTKNVILSNDMINHYTLHPGDKVNVHLYDEYVNLIVLKQYHGTPLKLWKTKICEQLGWNQIPKALSN